MEIVYSRRAYEDLRRLPPADRNRATARLRAYADDPAALSHDVIHLVGTPNYRLRVVDWRVVFQITAERVDVTRIGHRREVYR